MITIPNFSLSEFQGRENVVIAYFYTVHMCQSYAKIVNI